MKEQKPQKDENAEAVADLEIGSERAEEIQGGGTVPTIRPYDTGFRGGVRVAAGDVN